MSTSSRISLPTRNTIFGLWSNVPPSHSSAQNVDLEAQIVYPTRSASPVLPVPAPTHPSPSAPAVPSPIEPEQFDAVDIFFGVSQPRREREHRAAGTHESRHDSGLIPPPYTPAAEASLPTYEQTIVMEREPATLAMYLFKYGFLFPLFWAAGSLILISPLDAPADWEPTKPAEERAQLVQLMRGTELKWAKRCLFAFAVCLLITCIAVAAALAIVRSQ